MGWFIFLMMVGLFYGLWEEHRTAFWAAIAGLVGLMMIAALVLQIVAWRDERRRQQTNFLLQLKTSREARQAEGGWVWDDLQRPGKGYRATAKGWKLKWRLIDRDDSGNRALVELKDRELRTFRALCGRDRGTGEGFLMTVPPNINTVHQAISYLWDIDPSLLGRGLREY